MFSHFVHQKNTMQLVSPLRGRFCGFVGSAIEGFHHLGEVWVGLAKQEGSANDLYSFANIPSKMLEN
jgi:hypothetical protein